MSDDEPVLRICLRTSNFVVLIFQNNSPKIIMDEFINKKKYQMFGYKTKILLEMNGIVVIYEDS